MRCKEIQEDLARHWNDGPTSTEVAEHLAQCPTCADYCLETSQLVRTWEATRPDSPTEGDWERVWARIDQAVEATKRPLPSGFATDLAPQRERRRWASLAPAGYGLGIALAAALLLAFALPRWISPPDQAVVAVQNDSGIKAVDESESESRSTISVDPADGPLEVVPGQIALYHLDIGELDVIVEESDGFDDFLTFHGHFETLDRGEPIRWFIDVDPGQTILYSIDRDVVTVVDEPEVKAWVPGVDDEFLSFFAAAECEFRSGFLALNGDPPPAPFAR